MYRRLSVILPVLAILWMPRTGLSADDSPSARRRQQAQEFHFRAQERTGVLVPMYVYPADVHKNVAYNRLMNLKRQYETVPMWVILNPASGPGKAVDANYTKAIDRLIGAGCVVLGYVTTSYGKRPQADVRNDIDLWLKMYPRIQGVFFDEMIYEDTDAGSNYQAALTRYAHDAGCWPTVANPGAETPGRYFAAGAAEVIVVHEGDAWPNEVRLKGDYFGGYSDYPPFSRGVLVHSQAKLDKTALQMVRKYARWVYVTEALCIPGDATAANPWDRLSRHLETVCEQLVEK
jgi:Spherulation-specific family 4